DINLTAGTPSPGKTSGTPTLSSSSKLSVEDGSSNGLLFEVLSTLFSSGLWHLVPTSTNQSNDVGANNLMDLLISQYAPGLANSSSLTDIQNTLGTAFSSQNPGS